MNSILPRDDLANPGTTSSKTKTATATRRATTRTASRTGTASRTATRSGGTVTHSGAHTTAQAGISQPVKAKPHLHASKAAIAGAVCGGIAVVVLLGLVIFLVWRQRRARTRMVGRTEKGIMIEPYIVDHPDRQTSSQKYPLPLPSRPMSTSQMEPRNTRPATVFTPGVPRSPPPDYLFHTMDMQQHPPSLYPPSTPDSNHFHLGNAPMGYPESHSTPEGSDIHILGGKSPINRYEGRGRIEQYRW